MGETDFVALSLHTHDDILSTVVRGFGTLYRLSEREFDVLFLAATGSGTKEIAVALGLSPRTVEQYWGRIYRKMACPDREGVFAALIRYCIADRLPSSALRCAPRVQAK